MKTINNEQTGKQLANGATVLAQTDNVVLAENGHEYVTWQVDPQGNTYWGHYFPGLTVDSLAEATADFQQRVQEAA